MTIEPYEIPILVYEAVSVIMAFVLFWKNYKKDPTDFTLKNSLPDWQYCILFFMFLFYLWPFYLLFKRKKK